MYWEHYFYTGNYSKDHRDEDINAHRNWTADITDSENKIHEFCRTYRYLPKLFSLLGSFAIHL